MQLEFNVINTELGKLTAIFSATLCCGATHNAIACNLKVFLGQRSLMEVSVKVAGCSARTEKTSIF